jgi:hypothetical protein
MKNKENVTIKSVTNCPTCGSECKVEGGNTHYYVPFKKYTEEDIKKAFMAGCQSERRFSRRIDELDKYINSLNKQDNENTI